MNSALRLALLALCAAAALAATGCPAPANPGDAGRDVMNTLDTPRPDTGPGLDVVADTSPGPDTAAEAARETGADAPAMDTGPDAGPGPDAAGDTGPSTDVTPGSCLNNTDCSPREYCAATSCSGRGTCTARPTACPTVFDPVCGCDGITYGNACGAAAAGARVASTGSCAGGDAGPLGCTMNSECTATQYCAAATCTGAGTCTARPTVCPDLVDPVCGCDGMDYGNSCEAAAAGVRVSSPGRCSSPPPTDGGTLYCATVRCASGTVCCESTRSCVPLGGRCPCAAPCAAGTVCCESVSLRGAGTCYDPRCLACCM